MNEQAEQGLLMTIRAQILASVDQYPTKQDPTSHSSKNKKRAKSYIKSQLQIIRRLCEGGGGMNGVWHLLGNNHARF
jgi:hypothetical protein